MLVKEVIGVDGLTRIEIEFDVRILLSFRAVIVWPALDAAEG